MHDDTKEQPMPVIATSHGVRAEEIEVPVTAPASTMARFVFENGVERLDLRAERSPDRLLRASFTQPVPIVRVIDHDVHVAYPVGARLLRRSHDSAVRISPATPWTLEVDGGAAHVDADLTDVDVRAMTFRGDAAHLRLRLGRPTQLCSIRLRSVSDLVIERPADVAVMVKISNGATKVRLDDRWFGAVGSGLAEQTPVRESSDGCYVVTVSGGADTFTVERSM
jgi:hypothetical protein